MVSKLTCESHRIFEFWQVDCMIPEQVEPPKLNNNNKKNLCFFHTWIELYFQIILSGF